MIKKVLVSTSLTYKPQKHSHACVFYAYQKFQLSLILLSSFSIGKVRQERIHWFVIIERKIEVVTGKDLFDKNSLFLSEKSENSSKAQAVHQK